MQTIEATTVFEWLANTKDRVNLLVGGAGSSKSYSIAQHLIRKFYEESNIRVLVTRKTTPSLRISAYKLILDLLKEYGWHYELNKSELTIKQGNNEILFKGLDDPEKIKSAEFNYIWAEEATDLTLDDYRQLNLRLRRKTSGINQIYLSCNPISALHWIKTELVDKRAVALNHSTYKNNPFLDDEYKKEIIDLINQDENYYKIYALGQWGVLKNIIYDRWTALAKPPEHYKDISYGIDWGYESPCALVKVYWLDGQKVVWEELIYEKGLTTPEFIGRAKKVIPPDERTREIYAGTDEPGSIQEFYNEGFNIHKAVTDVRDGINFCKSHLVGLIGSNLIKEAQGYKRKEDKDGNVLEDPVKFMDHGMDAGRYGSYSKVKGQFEAVDLNLSLR